MFGTLHVFLRSFPFRGLSLIYMGKKTQGLEDLRAASQAKEIEGHNVIDEAIQDGAEGYTVFSIVRIY